MRSRIITLCACAIVASLAMTGTASAHSFSWQRAESAGSGRAQSFADPGEYWYIDCEGGKISAHLRRCIVASYDPDADITCDAYIKIRMSRFSRRLRVGWPYSIDCKDGDVYDLVARYG